MIKFIRRLTALYLFFGVYGFAQVQPTTSSSSPTSAQTPSTPVSFSSEVKKAIVVVYTECKDDPAVYQGTGFFVSKTDPRMAQATFIYLVTNKHVVLPHVEEGKPCEVTRQRIRLNLKTADPNNGARNYFVTVTNPWVFHVDPSVDLAILPYAPNSSVFDYKAFPSAMLATSDVIESHHIGEGDPVFYVGYFYQLPGIRKIQPIMRQGIIAMMPDEPVTTTLNKPGLGYLADAHVFGGNSGSPMLVNLGGYRNGALSLGGNSHYVLGVISGMEPEDNGETLRAVVNYTADVKGNSGISFVIPALQVSEILDGPTLTQIREEAITKMPH